MITSMYLEEPVYHCGLPGWSRCEMWSKDRTDDWLHLTSLVYPDLDVKLVWDTEFAPWPDLLEERLVFAYDRHIPVGTAAIWRGTGGHRICWLEVRPDYRGFGIGRGLMSKLFDIYREQRLSGPLYLSTQNPSYFYQFGFSLPQ